MSANFLHKTNLDLKRRSRGFTMIELVVVAGIILLLTAGGLAGYLAFNDRQTVLEAANQLRLYIYKAQNKATVGDVGDCTKLEGYRLSTVAVASITQVSLQEICAIGTAGAAEVIELPSGVMISPNLNFVFKILNGGICLDGDCYNATGPDTQVVTFTRGSVTHQYTVSQGGEIGVGT